MPEGPQIVFLKEQAGIFVDQEVIIAKSDYTEIPIEIISGQPLRNIKSFGKELLLCFPDFTIRVHLMFFGKYAINGSINRQLTLGLTFENGDLNFYACHCIIIQNQLNLVYDWEKDVMQENFNFNQAFTNLRSQPEKLICDALLDQSILAGVGNGIKNEALFQAQIHPENMVGIIPETHLKSLIKACVIISFEYLQWLKEEINPITWRVYRQKVCPRDHLNLRKEKLGKTQRSSYFCEKCQVLYHPDFS